MAIPFARTVRAQAAERSVGSAVAAGVAALLLAAWMAWFFFARIALYEVSERARIEAVGKAHAVDAPLSARIVSSSLTLERRVEIGDVLVELDASLVKQQLAEARATHDALPPRVEARRAEIASEESLRGKHEQEALKAIEAARAYRSEAEATLHLAEDELQRTSQLATSGAASQAQLVHAKSDVAQKSAKLKGLTLEVDRLERQRESGSGEISVRTARLRSEITDLEGQLESSAAAAAALEESLARHTIRAPVAGRIAEAGDKRPGGYVSAGERLAVIVPDGALRVSGEFTPAHAIGRIQVGQRARLRLDGYPWLQYGSVRARVDRVGAEPRDGLVHVELTIEADPSSTIPMQHGLSGQLEVAVEQLTPYALTLRATGRGLSKDGP